MPAMWDRLRTVPHKQGGIAFDADNDDRIGLGLGLNYGTRNAPRGYSYSIKGGPAPPRPPREFFESRYETAPPVQEPPPRNPNRITLRTSNFRPPSSVYSQQSSAPVVPDYPVNLASRHAYRYGGADEISPPSSPEPYAGPAGRFLPGDVSPIDEDDQPTASRHAAPQSTDMSRNERSGRSATPESRQATRSSPQTRGGTSIPMMRRERRKQSDAAMREANSGQRGPAQLQSRNQPAAREALRWDPLTGERTESAAGRPAQVNPAEFAQGLGITTQASASPQTSPTAAPPSFGDRVRRIAKRAQAAREGNANTDPAAGAFTSSRPGWRGASGRTAIVDPVHDTPEVAPLKIPEKSSKRYITPATESGSKLGLKLGGPLRRGQTPPMSPPPSEATTKPGPREALRRILPSSQQAQSGTHSPSPGEQSYPSPPLSGTPLTGDAPAVAARELAQDGLASISALPSPTFNNGPYESAIRRKPPPPAHNDYQSHHQHQVSVSSVYSQPSEAPHPAPLRIPVTQAASSSPNDEPWVQPPSRFSITTYATSNTGTTREDGDDLVDEEQPPVPSLPADFQHANNRVPTHRPSSENSPVTSPIDQFMTSPFASPDSEHQPAMEQHPPAAQNPAIARAQALAVDRPSSRASDINKSLPPAPPEASAGEAQDRVGLLNAQLRALANRRININRSIKQMTELMPTDKLLNSAEVVRKREEEKRKVEALRQELSDVQREEYELGLKLHRAYKRLDREAEWEPTTLWVRRVTK